MVNPIQTLAMSDTGFVFDPRTGHAYTVNATGLAVLRGLKEGRSLAEVTKLVEDDFDQTIAVEDGVRRFLQLLEELGLLPESEAGAR
jgi:PqqD family protein of HPr-rel-A system